MSTPPDQPQHSSCIYCGAATYGLRTCAAHRDLPKLEEAQLHDTSLRDAVLAARRRRRHDARRNDP